MKKLILIVLLILLSASYINTPVLAKVKFGKWDKWDQQLPDMDNKYWSWTFPGEKSTMLTLDDKSLLITTYLYFGTSKNRASVIFYSPASQKTNIKKDYIPDPKFAFVCFPPKKKKSMIRVYEIKNIEEGLSQFLEEWEIYFNQHQDGVPPGVEFRENFKEWLNQQAPSELAELLKTINQENILNIVLPRLRIDGKGKFTLVPPISDDFINIISVTPDSGLVNGVSTDFTVVVKYNLASFTEGELTISFNNLLNNKGNPGNHWYVESANYHIIKGYGTHEFNVTVKPKDWKSKGDFDVNVCIDELPHIDDWLLDCDEKILTFKK